MLNVKLNAILLKTGHLKQILWQQEVLIDMNKFPRIFFFKFWCNYQIGCYGNYPK